MRSSPMEGTARRLTRLIGERYAMSISDVARLLKISYRHAWRYVTKLETSGKIYPRYRHDRAVYYSVRRDE